MGTSANGSLSVLMTTTVYRGRHGKCHAAMLEFEALGITSAFTPIRCLGLPTGALAFSISLG